MEDAEMKAPPLPAFGGRPGPRLATWFNVGFTEVVPTKWRHALYKRVE